MNSDSLPTASTPRPTDNVEVLSQKASSRGDVVLGAPRGDLPDPGRKGRKTTTGSEFGPQPNTAPEPPMVPDSGRRSPVKGGQPPVLVSSVHPEAPDNLLEALRGASIDEEHRTIMSAVIEKVQSAKNGLTEACASLLTGFEVGNQNIRKYYCIDTSPCCSIPRSRRKAE